ncbi:amidohydrolase [Amycolatopsis sp. NBRC 101858]|uniref:amidohydrolase family protein n=1 Tax=Amycolatopsis sp. NBRC 101858 TaxID=3032200 RepID=UPI0024A537EA|nr:amidohydrolase family protein [Amycolatopsis sp. NBRC 101858]GLY40462.1 amidohydrolase [Amycolatopsis sp. NBRC 101858]
MTGLLDAHVHFWDPRRLRYPWLDGIADLDRPFTPGNFPGRPRSDVIVVEAGRVPAEAAGEIAWLREEARRQPWIRGVVAHVDVERPAATSRFVTGYGGDPFVAGVRRNVQDEAPGFLRGTGFRAGVRLLGEAGLPFDACVRAHQLPELTELAAACPRTTIVLDHLGKPAPGGPGYERWRRDLRRLARHANVLAKLSGLATETTPGTPRSLVVDAVREALDVFGPERCLFGSDWPVMTLATDYEAWLDVVHDALATHPATAAEAVLHDNAVRTYRTRSRGNAALSRHGSG